MDFLQASWLDTLRMEYGGYIVIGLFIFGVLLLVGVIYWVLHAHGRRQHDSDRR